MVAAVVRLIKARQRSAIRANPRPDVIVGYQYHPPKKRWRDKARDILRIIRE